MYVAIETELLNAEFRPVLVYCNGLHLLQLIRFLMRGENYTDLSLDPREP